MFEGKGNCLFLFLIFSRYVNFVLCWSASKLSLVRRHKGMTYVESAQEQAFKKSIIPEGSYRIKAKLINEEFHNPCSSHIIEVVK